MKILLFLFLAGCASQPFDLYDPTPTEDSPAKADPIVRIKADDLSCTGFVIDDHYVITAAHCIPDEYDTITVLSLDKTIKVKATLFDYSEQADYAALKGDFSKFNRLGIISDTKELVNVYRANNLSPRLMSCGTPYKGELLCANVTGADSYYEKVIAGGFNLPGTSGGPVIDKQTMKAVGVIHGLLGDKVILAPLYEILTNLGLVGKDE